MTCIKTDKIARTVSAWITCANVRRKSNILSWFVVPRLGIALVLVFSMFPLNALALNKYKTTTFVDRDDDIDYDHRGEGDPFVEYRKWKEQTMLGKGQKIGEGQPELPDSITHGSDIRWPVIDKMDASVGESGNKDIKSRNTQRPELDANTGEGARIPHEVVRPNTQNSPQVSTGSENSAVSTDLGNVNRGLSVPLTSSPSSDLKETTGSVSLPGQTTASASYATLKLPEDLSFYPNSGYVRNSSMGRAEVHGEEKLMIYIAGLFPWSRNIPEGAVGRGVLPAVRIALNHVNADTRVSRKYTLKMAYNDTQVSTAV